MNIDREFSVKTPLNFSLNPTSKLRLKPFEQQDVEPIKLLEDAVTPFPWALDNFYSSVNSTHVCLGCQNENDQWIAYCIFSMASEEAELLLIGVDKAWQKLGVASAILSIVIDCIKGSAQQFFLEVRESNYAARAFYESFGFNEIGIRKNYYPISKGKEHAIIYGLELKYL